MLMANQSETVSRRDLLSLVGPVLSCGGVRGEFRYGNGGYAALGQLIADVTGSSYPDAVARLVFEPLGMTGSSFPDRWPDADAVTGYNLTTEGAFEPAPDEVCTVPSAGVYAKVPGTVTPDAVTVAFNCVALNAAG